MNNELLHTTRIIIFVIFILTIMGLSGYWFYKHYFRNSATNTINQSSPSVSKQSSMPTKISDNKFGFLSGSPKETGFITKAGAGWIRPHPGPFLWDAMQKNKDNQINFSHTDEVVKTYQNAGIGTLATLWPFADWEQGRNPNCKVSSQDEFLAKNDKKERGDYLPEYRCNPVNWDLYQQWVKKLVERYDGDGLDDMPDLKIPLKYWEVLNEPDLSAGPELDFYTEEDAPKAYQELLIKTSQAIRQSDPNAKILIAGAAGGSEQFLNFYRQVLKNKQAVDSFDIGNVHCISNDEYQNFNVAPYKQVLKEFKIDKPIWVTEAQAIISNEVDINATQTLNSTQEALANGAQKIFYTNYDFKLKAIKTPPTNNTITARISGSNPEETYKLIISQN